MGAFLPDSHCLCGLSVCKLKLIGFVAVTDAELIRGIQSPGSFDATVGSEADALRIIRMALPHALELAPAIAGFVYPPIPKGTKAWFQLHPAEPSVGHAMPHVKYADWTKGKKGRGGSWGHLFFRSLLIARGAP